MIVDFNILGGKDEEPPSTKIEQMVV